MKVTRGDRKGTEGKVTKVDKKKYRLFIEGITQQKVDGTAVPTSIHPSKVMITNLNLEDKWRRESIKASALVEKTEKIEVPEERPQKKEISGLENEKGESEKTEESEIG